MFSTSMGQTTIESFWLCTMTIKFDPAFLACLCHRKKKVLSYLCHKRRPDHTFQSGKNPKSETEPIVCLIKHHKTLNSMLFYTHKGLIKVAHVQDHLSEAVHPSRDNFMTSCAWFPSNCPPCGSPAGGSSPAKVANTTEFHPEIRGTAFPQRPSCHIRPVSEGHSQCRSLSRRRRPQRAAPGPPPGGLPKPPGAGARCLGPEGAAGDGDGTRQVAWVASGDFGGFRVWKIRSLVMFGPPFLIENVSLPIEIRINWLGSHTSAVPYTANQIKDSKEHTTI